MALKISFGYKEDADFNIFIGSNWNDYGFYTGYIIRANERVTGSQSMDVGYLRIMMRNQRTGYNVLHQEFGDKLLNELPENCVSTVYDSHVFEFLITYLTIEERREFIKAFRIVLTAIECQAYAREACFNSSLIRDRTPDEYEEEIRTYVKQLYVDKIWKEGLFPTCDVEHISNNIPNAQSKLDILEKTTYGIFFTYADLLDNKLLFKWENGSRNYIRKAHRLVKNKRGIWVMDVEYNMFSHNYEFTKNACLLNDVSDLYSVMEQVAVIKGYDVLYEESHFILYDSVNGEMPMHIVDCCSITEREIGELFDSIRKLTDCNKSMQIQVDNDSYDEEDIEKLLKRQRN